MTHSAAASRVDNIRRSLVHLKMPRALEMLDATLRQIEQGQIDGIEAIGDLLSEELSLRESRRIKAALRMAWLPVTIEQHDRFRAILGAAVTPHVRLGLRRAAILFQDLDPGLVAVDEVWRTSRPLSEA